MSLIMAWFLVISGLPAYLNLQLASWLTFIALLITPGYFLAGLITWHMRLDWLERLALALLLGLAALALFISVIVGVPFVPTHQKQARHMMKLAGIKHIKNSIL